MKFILINIVVIICFAFFIFFGAISFSNLLERESRVDCLYWQFSTTEKDSKSDIENCKRATKMLDEKAKVFNNKIRRYNIGCLLSLSCIIMLYKKSFLNSKP